MNAHVLLESLIPAFTVDTNHKVTHWNHACERFTGTASSTIIGTDKHWTVFYSSQQQMMADCIVDGASPEKMSHLFGSEVQKSALIEGAYHLQRCFYDRKNRAQWLYCTASPLKNGAGELIGAIETFQDITCQKEREASLKNEIAQLRAAQQSLLQSEYKFRAIADSTSDWIHWINQDGQFVYLSPSFERITGYKRNQFSNIREIFQVVVHPDDRKMLLQHLDKEILSAQALHLDFRIITTSGEERWISHTCVPIYDDSGAQQGRRVSNRDITRRKQLEKKLLIERENLEKRVDERTRELKQAYADLLEESDARRMLYQGLQESRAQLSKRNEFIETILDNLPIGIAVGSMKDGFAQYMNASFIDIYGWPKEILSDFDQFLEHVYPSPEHKKIIKNKTIKDVATYDPGKMVWNNLHHRTQSGELRVVNARGIPLPQQELIIAIVQDITEKYQSDEALQLTRFSIDQADDMIYWVDHDGHIVDVNKTTSLKLQYTRDELLTMTVMDIVPDLTREDFLQDWEVARHKRVWREDANHISKDGKVIPAEIHINHIRFGGKEFNCFFARDITERRELEELVARQDKMGSLGRVTAGIAHEIRNPLSTINVYLSALNRCIADGDRRAVNLDDLKEALHEMSVASNKIESVIKRVMDFSRPSPCRLQLVDINQCVKNAVDLSRVTLRKEGISLLVTLEEHLPECNVESQLIEQVIINLITNALEELTQGEQQDRTVEVKTSEGRRKNGERVVSITVSDSGSGVPAELRDKIFDPFFTTKHYGAGIGLSICQRIISDHRGTFHVASNRWGGAVFTVEIPVEREATH